jgi:hypothetical protein
MSAGDVVKAARAKGIKLSDKFVHSDPSVVALTVVPLKKLEPWKLETPPMVPTAVENRSEGGGLYVQAPVPPVEATPSTETTTLTAPDSVSVGTVHVNEPLPRTRDVTALPSTVQETGQPVPEAGRPETVTTTPEVVRVCGPLFGEMPEKTG